MTAPDPATVAAAALAAVQYLQQQGMATLAPVWAGGTPNLADLPPLQCKACGNELDADTWPAYVEHMLANHHSLLEQYASMTGTDVPRVKTKGADAGDWPVDHAKLASTLGQGGWPHDPGVRVHRNA